MTSKDEHVTSDTFDIPNSIITLDSNQLKSSHNLCNNYLRETIGEPLSYALAYMIIYRPEDPIEFISNFLIDWSRKTTRQKVIDHKSNNILVQSLVNKQEENDSQHLLKECKEEELVFQSDKHLSSSDQDNSHDKQESSNYFQEQKQQTHRINTQHYIHTHDTASGFDDEMKSNQENNRNHICQNDNLSSFTYFSKLRDKIIKCDES